MQPRFVLFAPDKQQILFLKDLQFWHFHMFEEEYNLKAEPNETNSE